MDVMKLARGQRALSGGGGGGGREGSLDIKFPMFNIADKDRERGSWKGLANKHPVNGGGYMGNKIILQLKISKLSFSISVEFFFQFQFFSYQIWEVEYFTVFDKKAQII